MRIIGFHFTKVSIERLKESKESLKISTEIDVPEIKQIKTDVLKTKEGILESKFTYKVKYDPDFAELEFKGLVLIAVDSKTAKEVLKGWKNKKMPEDFRMLLFNFILRKANLKALELEDELNLPPHIPLPSLKKGEEEKTNN
jgi:hypothetical protein